MIIMDQAVAVGVFYERAAAEKALAELRTAGFTDEQVGFVARDHHVPMSSEHGASDVVPATAGAVGGGVLGGVLGAVSLLLIPGLGPAIAGGMLAITLGGVALGAVAGGFAGSLIHMGISEEDAYYYQMQLDSGRTIVTVKAAERYEEAMSILHQAGAITTGRDAFPAGSDRASAIMNDYTAGDLAMAGAPEIYPAAPAASSGTESMINPGLSEAERAVATPHVTNELNQPAVSELTREDEEQKVEEEEADEHA